MISGRNKTGRDQQFNDGLVVLCNVKNIAAPGNRPVEGLEQKATLRFAERTVGIQRFYSALQANAKVERLVRCLRRRDISTQDIAVVGEQQYKIELIQYPEGNSPAVMDLTLTEVAQRYDYAR